MDNVLNFPNYYYIRQVFTDASADMRKLSEYTRAAEVAYKRMDTLGNFIDNHDVDRFLYARNDTAALMNALAYLWGSRGIPILYYGTEQGFSSQNNRQLMWNFGYSIDGKLASFVIFLNSLRTKYEYYKSPIVELQSEKDLFIFRRSPVIFMLSNRGAGSPFTATLSLEAGKYCDFLENCFCSAGGDGANSLDTQNSGLESELEFLSPDGQPIIIVKTEEACGIN